MVRNGTAFCPATITDMSKFNKKQIPLEDLGNIEVKNLIAEI